MPKPPISSHDAAKESNLPSRGLPGPASFEDWMGHQARAAPRMIVGLGARHRGVAVRHRQQATSAAARMIVRNEHAAATPVTRALLGAPRDRARGPGRAD